MQIKTSFSAHSALIKEILTHIKTVADAANLSTESALDLHYINISLVDNLPMLVEILGQTRGFGAGQTAKKYMDAEQRLHLASLTSRIENINEQLTNGLNIAFADHPVLLKKI